MWVCHLIDFLELLMLTRAAAALFWLGVLFPRLVRHLIIISPLTMDAAEMEIDVI